MPTTDRMNWPFPSFRQDPWFDDAEALANQQDASAFAAREDRNLVLMGGGLITWDASTDTLTWASDLEIFSPITGFKEVLAAGSITVETGEAVYVTLTRNPTQEIALSAAAASQVPSNDNALLLAVRNGSRIYFRNGETLADGDSVELLSKRPNEDRPGLRALNRLDHTLLPGTVAEAWLFDGDLTGEVNGLDLTAIGGTTRFPPLDGHRALYTLGGFDDEYQRPSRDAGLILQEALTIQTLVFLNGRDGTIAAEWGVREPDGDPLNEANNAPWSIYIAGADNQLVYEHRHGSGPTTETVNSELYVPHGRWVLLTVTRAATGEIRFWIDSTEDPNGAYGPFTLPTGGSDSTIRFEYGRNADNFGVLDGYCAGFAVSDGESLQADVDAQVTNVFGG